MRCRESEPVGDPNLLRIEKTSRLTISEHQWGSVSINYSSLRNSSMVRPASLIIDPMVMALTGLWRGIDNFLVPSVKIVCFPCRSIQNPAL